MADDTTVRVDRATLDRVQDAASRSGFRLTAKAATATGLRLLADLIEGRTFDVALRVKAPGLVFTLAPNLRRRLNQVARESPDKSESAPSTLTLHALPPKGFRTFHMAPFSGPNAPAPLLDLDAIALSDGKVWVQLLEEHAQAIEERQSGRLREGDREGD